LGVIGLGALGGSVAWQATRSGVPNVIGYARDRRDGAAALRSGAITELATRARAVLERAELTVLAGPPKANLTILRQHADLVRERACLVTDVTSVKGPILDLAIALHLGGRFVGSHPLRGTHRSGFDAARPDLLSGAVVFVVPVKGHDDSAGEVADFWASVYGASPVWISADQHDRLMGWTSHLPQVVSSALAVALARAAQQTTSYGSGLREVTRLAASSSEMWRDILLMNRDALDPALTGLEAALRELRLALNARDAAAVEGWLEEGARFRRDIES
jgi:prephenate dehydrogenase